MSIYTRSMRFVPPANLADTDPIPATLATSEPVQRNGFAEILDCSPAGVDLTRAPLPLICSHDGSQLAVGVVENLQPTGTKLTGLVRFSTSPAAQQIRADVVAGIHRSLSVGYQHLSATETNTGTVYRWQPHECSIVSVPADPKAGFFRNFSNPKPMTTETLNPEAAEIKDLCTRHNMPELADGLTRDGSTMAQAGIAVLTELARRDRASGGHHNFASFRCAQDADSEREVLVNSLVHRLGGKPAGEIIRNTDCTGLATRALEMFGHAVSPHDSRDSVLQRAMTTGDFPNLLGTAAGRVLLAAFEDAPPALRRVARLNNLPDFKSRTVLRFIGGTPSLEKVNEHGEFTHGSMDEGGNSWSLATYGRIVSLTRQALINDNLNAFGSLLSEFGRSAARRESDVMAALLTGTPQVDSANLFDVSRNTLITSSALSVTSLAAAVKALRLQKETGGGFVNQEPGYLVVPASLEFAARQLVAVMAPTEAANVQPFQGLTVITEPRLDASSVTTWFLVSGNQSALEYGYLDGATGPQTFQQDGWEVDGTQFKCRLDFGAGFVAPLGWVKATA